MKLACCMLLIVLTSCFSKKQSDIVLIKGIVKNLPTTKVYLTDAFKWKVFLDSANYKNDTFSFRISSKNFRPYLASISFIDRNGKIIDANGNRQVLIYLNYLLATEDKKYGETAFVLDKGITTISGTYSSSRPTIKTDKLKINGSKQNDPFFKTQLSDFGWISAKDSLKRKEIINSYKKLIKQYPDSYYFISTLYNYRFQYSEKEMANMLDLFENTYTTDYFKQKFIAYFKELPSSGTPLHNYTFKNSLNQAKSIIDTSAKLNMVIFWATWCGPCRQEIPQLKQIYVEFKNSNIHMVSVSLDDKKEIWKSLLQKEKMDWEQLIADSTLLEEVKNSFKFDAIPLVVFTDSKGVEITRSSDYKPENKSKYEDIIKKYIN
jgi:thiol-disulfide isomerase/thioredoxin